MENKVEICRLCEKEIHLDKDSYVRLTDYFKGKFYAEGFYHNKCYKDRINKGSKLQQVAMGLAKRTNKMLDDVGIPKEEVVINLGSKHGK